MDYITEFQDVLGPGDFSFSFIFDCFGALSFPKFLQIPDFDTA